MIVCLRLVLDAGWFCIIYSDKLHILYVYPQDWFDSCKMQRGTACIPERMSVDEEIMINMWVYEPGTPEQPGSALFLRLKSRANTIMLVSCPDCFLSFVLGYGKKGSGGSPYVVLCNHKRPKSGSYLNLPRTRVLYGCKCAR